MAPHNQTLEALKIKIEQKDSLIGVIGLGYVGLPVAVVFADAGFDVIGVDVKEERVDAINAGRSPIEGKEPGLADLLASVVESGRFIASTDYEDLGRADVILIAVETPIDDDHIPGFEALKSALKNLGPVMKAGALVIVESTIAPGTMEKLVRPFLEELSGRKVDEDIFLGHCPERVMPGKLLKNLRTVSRVCGGYSPETAVVMVALYDHIVDADLDPTDCVTAELVKTAENAYRDVNIAFANELALICEAVGGNVWDVRELVNKSPGRNVLLPGAGVGGHCIPKEPWLLAYGAEGSDVPLRLIPAAREINDGMPQHIAEMTLDALRELDKNPETSTVVVLGYAYLENSDDERNSPTKRLLGILEKEVGKVLVHDPNIVRYQGNVQTVVDQADAVVLMVAHDEYRDLITHNNAPEIVVDGRGLWREGSSMINTSKYLLVGKG